MSSSRKALLIALLGLAAAWPAAAQTRFEGIGRAATPAEIAAWDIDVRADFKGLPSGSGSVAKGMEVWEAKCASCHGIFGESNETFMPIIGGTTRADMQTGRVARLRDEAFPQRTTMMKLSELSTLWDYIRRAMPWNQPKSLSTEEVYAVTAYILNLAGVVPDNFTLSHQNIAQVQAQLPNRNGKTTDHALWPGRPIGSGAGARAATAPDVRAVACMSNCAAPTAVASFIPEHARNAHGNLAEQNRIVGPQRGADTTRPAGSPLQLAVAAPRPAATAPTTQDLLRKHNCLTCHGIENKVVGPGLREIVARHGSRADAKDYFAQRISGGSSGAWGPIPMPAQTLPAAELQAISAWLAAGAKN